MPRKLPINMFEWVEDISNFAKNFIKNYDQNSDYGYIPEFDDKYSKQLGMSHNDLLFLPEIIHIVKFQKIVCNLKNKEKYLLHIINSKQVHKHC